MRDQGDNDNIKPEQSRKPSEMIVGGSLMDFEQILFRGSNALYFVFRRLLFRVQQGLDSALGERIL